MSASELSKNEEVPTLFVRDSKGSELKCCLEQIVPIEGNEYALLSPKETPVSLFKIKEEGDPELIETIEKSEPILEVADVVLQEYDLKLVRSAVTLTVEGDLEEPDPEELEDEESNYYDFETFDLLVSFRVKEQEYGLFVPLDPYFIIGELKEGKVTLLEGEQFDSVQLKIEKELEEREFGE